MSGTGSSAMIEIILAVCIVGIIIFIIITSILNKKTQRKEKEKRKREVREKIKSFIKERENRQNLYIQFEKVLARKGKEFKNRDVFEVIINIYDAKSRNHIEDRAYEIEGISIPIDKKNYTHEWVVNSKLDLSTTRRRIGIIEGNIKLSKEEKKNLIKKQKMQKKEENLKLKSDLRENKKNKRKNILPTPEKLSIEEKFVPKREKKK